MVDYSKGTGMQPIRKDAAAWIGDQREHVEKVLEELENDPNPQIAILVALETERLIEATLNLRNKAVAVVKG